MSKLMRHFLFWSPRVLCMLFTAFLSLFALDVFTEETGFWEEMLALLIHLVPVYMVVIALVVAWKWEWVGAILFIALAIFYVVLSGGRQHWSAYAAICGSLIMIGVLFLLNWKYKAQLEER